MTEPKKMGAFLSMSKEVLREQEEMWRRFMDYHLWFESLTPEEQAAENERVRVHNEADEYNQRRDDLVRDTQRFLDDYGHDAWDDVKDEAMMRSGESE